jgi:DNA repair exonuclease SbcCD ATPase subunit
MRLLFCRLRHVRLHRELSLRFDPRLTLIGGPNEAGKSTLVEALHKGLFLKASATGRGVEELRSRLHGGLPEVEIHFEAGDQLWELRKRFSGGSGTCQLSAAGGPSLRGPEAEERLAALLGMEGPLEGRRIGQLPERWAHLWVRQGESGRNPLEGQGERYDLQRLVQQLQQRGSATALLSDLDQQVSAHIRIRLAELFTATGRVKAGSRLAQAQERVRQAAAAEASAQQRLADLEEAMEAWRQVGERLQILEQQERPALQERLRRLAEESATRQRLEAELQVRQAALAPLRQRLASLSQQQQQLHELINQLRTQEQERQVLLLQRQAWEQEQQAQRARLEQLQQQQERGRQQHLDRQRRQELAQLLLDQLQLTREEAQLTEHRDQFQRLQTQAAGVKQELAALPPIGTEEVRRLRAIEQRLARAEARQQALATRISLLAADQAVSLDGTPLGRGEERLLLEAAELSVGGGVRLRLCPGGGEAAGAAEAEQRLARAERTQLTTALAVVDSEAAEAIERRRRDLETELNRLRQAATAIPWSRLEDELAQMAPRRERLEQALVPLRALQQELAAEGNLPAGRSALEGWLAELRATGQSQQQALSSGEAALQQLLRHLEEGTAQANQQRQRLEQLAGSLQTLAERRQLLESNHGSGEQLAAERASQEQQLNEAEALVTSCAERLAAAGAEAESGGAAPQTLLERLDAERDSLFISRGQLEQRCASLGAEDPTAALERCRAEHETASAEAHAIETEAAALRLLQDLFDASQRELADRYSGPLNSAIGSYLEVLGAAPQRSQLSFDPARGFGNLELQQGSQNYRFEELSGGMREQLAAALRLALAEVLQPAYDGVLPLVFDDAFTNTDPERLAGLQAMLQLGVARGTQIIVLSCQPQAYASLIGTLGSRWDLGPGGAHPREAGGTAGLAERSRAGA